MYGSRILFYLFFLLQCTWEIDIRWEMLVTTLTVFSILPSFLYFLYLDFYDLLLAAFLCCTLIIFTLEMYWDKCKTKVTMLGSNGGSLLTSNNSQVNYIFFKCKENLQINVNVCMYWSWMAFLFYHNSC